MYLTDLNQLPSRPAGLSLLSTWRSLIFVKWLMTHICTVALAALLIAGHTEVDVRFSGHKYSIVMETRPFNPSGHRVVLLRSNISQPERPTTVDGHYAYGIGPFMPHNYIVRVCVTKDGHPLCVAPRLYRDLYDVDDHTNGNPNVELTKTRRFLQFSITGGDGMHAFIALWKVNRLGRVTRHMDGI